MLFKNLRFGRRFSKSLGAGIVNARLTRNGHYNIGECGTLFSEFSYKENV